MLLGIIGSRSLQLKDFSNFIPEGVTEIISGGARGIDSSAEAFARQNGYKVTVIKPEYHRFKNKHFAPLARNVAIVEKSDCILAFWDCVSKGTLYTIRKAIEYDKPVILHIMLKNGLFSSDVFKDVNNSDRLQKLDEILEAVKNDALDIDSDAICSNDSPETINDSLSGKEWFSNDESSAKKSLANP